MSGLQLAGQRGVRVVAIVRGCPAEHVLKICGAAVAAGITALEVTLDSEDPLEGISSLRSTFPGVTVGAGTVLSGKQVVSAHRAGAEFIVSPVTDSDVIAAALGQGLFCIPGAATPTEIREAFAFGANAVKVFPADLLGGPAFLRAVLTPLGAMPLVPTGGVTAENARAYLEAGAAAIAVGSGLFPRSALETGDIEAVATRAEALVSATA